MTSPAPTQHRPVLLRETIQGMELKPGMTVIDGTVGAAGHSSEIWKRIQPGGRLIGLDRDPEMLARSSCRLGDSADLIHASYLDANGVLEHLGVEKVDRLLVDLGLSSDQLADDQRGFGFATEGQLDMRFDMTQGKPVHHWLNKADVAEITKVLSEYGEEPQAAQIAAKVVDARRSQPITSVAALREIIEKVAGGRGRAAGKSHPATRTFQALRIFANAELEHLQRFLTITAPYVLKPGGLLAVITFHSLEDRLTKQALADREVWADSSKKPIGPTPLEIKMNPRSRSAKLRIGIRAEAEIDHISAES
ncbi:16S rRNA (cytosine(1402)-N(4))-methyltransferase RsmH [Rubinisphaera brasiliensis]|uniref:Ribosomal RNA small subunit methyltransferase H n=1 Tax=Rubinisphaera brasiliensis (strain ATCC 49424 / DSM 5305 / JCM 21570 / IAM 15109 / NBRC 103401 / IFAM 1448) TaxID=756272 RepID=F0SQF3_RUBBR|nr:16S rRNA (cytosine(1402)-N(4))-methyltransferase RsmH [Rubinisphaera brasiliensis]ADY57928.1 Ribosomal RNA small subunit methyltransferase H [Rubinisphaera brasiliensis DSM 5305]